MDGHTRVLYKQKRKAALIGVLTLGLAGLTLVGMGWVSYFFSSQVFRKLLDFCF